MLYTLTDFTSILFIHAPYIWALIAIIFMLLEMAVPGLFFFISFAVGAFAAAVGATFNFGIAAQCSTALVTSVVAFFVIQRFLKRSGLSQSEIANVGSIEGLQGTVVKEIKENSTGHVKVGGEIWSAKTSGGKALSTGSRVRILRIEGNKLIVVQTTAAAAK
ncbi:NfeD family protein [Candidatus Dependentiae bacterium]